MKFKPGNLLKHENSAGLWIVVEALPINKKGPPRRPTVFKLQMTATCVQPGNSSLHYPGISDIWLFQEKDGSDHDDMWTVINEI